MCSFHLVIYLSGDGGFPFVLIENSSLLIGKTLSLRFIPPAPSSLCPIERYISVNVRCPVCIPHRKYTGFLREHRRVIKGQLISALTYFYQCNGKMSPQLRGREKKTEAALRIQPKQCKIF